MAIFNSYVSLPEGNVTKLELGVGIWHAQNSWFPPSTWFTKRWGGARPLRPGWSLKSWRSAPWKGRFAGSNRQTIETLGLKNCQIQPTNTENIAISSTKIGDRSEFRSKFGYSIKIPILITKQSRFRHAQNLGIWPMGRCHPQSMVQSSYRITVSLNQGWLYK
jgi:hypothetical protein